MAQRLSTTAVLLALAVMCTVAIQAQASDSHSQRRGFIKTGCSLHAKPESCGTDKRCSWCSPANKASPTAGCFPRQAARLLPSTFTCTVDDDPCGKKDEDACVSPECVWCTSAAVGGGCYTPDEAKLLPSAIFKCKTSPTARRH